MHCTVFFNWHEDAYYLGLSGKPATILQCVSLCWSVLQCVQVYWSVLQCVAVCCSVLQCVAMRYSVITAPFFFARVKYFTTDMKMRSRRVWQTSRSCGRCCSWLAMAWFVRSVSVRVCCVCVCLRMWSCVCVRHACVLRARSVSVCVLQRGWLHKFTHACTSYFIK